MQVGSKPADNPAMTFLRSAFHRAAAAGVLALLLGGCSGGSGNAPTAPGGTPLPVGSSFNFSFPATGVSHTYAFPDTGDWHYLCLKHGSQGMRGTVFVRASSLRDSAYVQVGFGGATVYSPDTVTIKPNGTVRWKNVSTDVQHTATSN
jgi:plastocyanin